MISPSRLELRTYVSVFSAVVMVAWYTTSLTKHYSFKGHLFGSLQLPGLGGVFSSGGVFCLRMVLFCPSTIFFMLGEQLYLSLIIIFFILFFLFHFIFFYKCILLLYCFLSLNFVAIILLMYINPSDATVYPILCWSSKQTCI